MDVGGGVWVCRVIFLSNPTLVMLGWAEVETIWNNLTAEKGYCLEKNKSGEHLTTPFEKKEID